MTQIKYVGLLLIFAIITLGVTIPQSYSQGASDDVVVGARIQVDPTIPTAELITTSVLQNQPGLFNFHDAINDDDADSALIITFETITGATGPVGVNTPFADFFTFNTQGQQITEGANGQFIVDSAALDTGSANYTPSEVAPPGQYRFPYTVTDSDSNTGSNFIQIDIAARSTNAAPTVVTNIERTETTNFTIDFYANVDDDATSDENLVIAFTYTNGDQQSIFRPDNTAAVDSTDANRYTLVTNPVSFILGTAPTSDTVIALTYTATDRNNLTSTIGTITITFDVDEGSVALNIDDIPDVNVVYRAGTSYEQTFDATAFADLINAAANNLTDEQVTAATIGFNSTVNVDHTTVDTASAITFTESSGDRILQYTPKDTTEFPFTETFVFTITANSRTGTGLITFDVVASECGSNNVVADGFTFGDLFEGQASEERTFTVENTGNVDLNLILSTENWTDTETAPTDVMLVGTTGYATSTSTAATAALMYAEKTQFTLDDVNIGTVDQNDQEIHLQVRVDLIDKTFEGAIQQIITTTTSCTV